MKPVDDEQKIKNFTAFSKLYGYIRFFHPSDEAAGINWSKFAVYGMMKVEKSKDNNELKDNLLDVFKPIAPSVEIFTSGNEVEFDKSKIIPADTSGLQIVTWQHNGAGLNEQSTYKSVRLNRFSDAENSFGTITNSIDAKTLRSKKIKLTAAIRVEAEGKNNNGHLWLRVDRENKEMGFFDNMDDRPITGKEWKEYEITGDVAGDAVNISFGCFLRGEGSLWVDNFHLYVQSGNKWNEISITNPDFENDRKFLPPQGWNYTKEDYFIEVIEYNPFKGKKCVAISSNLKKQLFDKYAVPGDFIKKNLTEELICIVPLSLYSDKIGTLTRADKLKYADLVKSLDSLQEDNLDGNNLYTRLADIAMVWNVIQHFYPYFDIYNVNWESALPKYLSIANYNKGELKFNETLNMMMSEINDGHAGSYFYKDKFNFKPPVILDFVESEVVVSKLLSKDTGLKEGDIVREIDGVNIKEKIEEQKKKVSSATDGWKMHIIFSRLLLRGHDGSDIKLKIERDDEIFDATLKRNLALYSKNKTERYPEYRPENISEIKNGIYYLNLDAITTDEINAVMPELENAKGLILDMRGYPAGNDALITHLIDEQITSARWNVPQIIYPDRENITGFDTSGRWEVKPEQPRIKGKVVYLTNGSAISYAESIMGIVEAYKLGEIVGEPTAGTNGNVNPIGLLGGYNVTWTGMKVLKHDGSQHHGIGIHPTYPVHRTIKGVREKRDEFVEKALEIIEQSTK